MDAAAVWGVALVYLPGVMIPGPNFVAVTHRAVTASRREALALVGGIVCVNLLWAASALLGVAAVFKTFPLLAEGMRWLAVAYLAWLGLRLLLAPGTPPAERCGQPRKPSLRRAFVEGVAVNIVNPKSMAFFAAVFTAAVPEQPDPATLLAMLATVAVVASTWYGLVASVLSVPRVAAAFLARFHAFNRACGACLLGLALKQALAR